MRERIYKELFDEKMPIKERLFRIILIVGIVAVTAAIIQGLTLVNALDLMVIYFIMLVCLVIAFVATFRFRNTNFSAALIGIAIVGIATPEIFFKGGCVNSGSAVWMCLGIFYIFLMFSGKTLVVALLLTLFVDISCYIYAFYHPEYVVELATRFEQYFDSAFAVIIVSVTIGIILKFQYYVYEQEREINEKQRKELEALSKSKDAFFAGMSHEIRTPINAIIGLNELILREEPSRDIQEYAKNIQGASKMLLSLINDILDLSQLEVQRMELVEKEYSTADMFHEILDMIENRAKDKKLNLIIDIDKHLPSSLIGDDRRIKQVAINLLTNAIKYTNEGAVTFRVSYDTVETPDSDDVKICLKIAVADTGIGIRKEEIDYLFDAFQRADVRKNHKIEGTGLGLSICKQLVDLMGGTITVDSIYTQGSIFTMTVEQVVANDAPIKDFLETDEETKSGAYYKKSFEAPDARVLIIDDDELNLIITTKLLEGTKMSIDTACTPDEALRKTKKRYYNLILMDYLMPGMDGGRLLHEIRIQENGLCKDSSVVLLSANVFADKQTEYFRMGFNGLLEKPINVQQLEEEAMRHIPDELIEFRSDMGAKTQGDHFISGVMSKKHKKICVTTDSLADLPLDMREKYDIQIIDLYIKTEHGRFKDSAEIDINNISRYMSDNSSTAFSLAPTVEDYERFFAHMLTEAEDVFYISMAKGVGKCYENALVASRGFDHVHVIDSGHVSAGQALLVLYAAKMVKNDASIYHIAAEIEKVKKRIYSTQLVPGTQILSQKGFTDPFTAQLCELFKFHPVLRTINSKVAVVGVRLGKLERVWRRYIRHHLRNIRHIDSSVVYIVHAGCSVRQQEIILEEVNRQLKFSEVYMTQTSVSNVCNAGLKSIGFAFYKK